MCDARGQVMMKAAQWNASAQKVQLSACVRAWRSLSSRAAAARTQTRKLDANALTQAFEEWMACTKANRKLVRSVGKVWLRLMQSSQRNAMLAWKDLVCTIKGFRRLAARAAAALKRFLAGKLYSSFLSWLQATVRARSLLSLHLKLQRRASRLLGMALAGWLMAMKRFEGAKKWGLAFLCRAMDALLLESFRRWATMLENRRRQERKHTRALRVLQRWLHLGLHKALLHWKDIADLSRLRRVKVTRGQRLGSSRLLQPVLRRWFSLAAKRRALAHRSSSLCARLERRRLVAALRGWEAGSRETLAEKFAQKICDRGTRESRRRLVEGALMGWRLQLRTTSLWIEALSSQLSHRQTLSARDLLRRCLERWLASRVARARSHRVLLLLLRRRQTEGLRLVLHALFRTAHAATRQRAQVRWAGGKWERAQVRRSIAEWRTVQVREVRNRGVVERSVARQDRKSVV